MRHVYLGLPEARRLLRFGRTTKVFDTGNPIAPPSPERERGRAASVSVSMADVRWCMVTGGSQGALAINGRSPAWLDTGGPADASLIWVTGRGTYDEFVRYHRPPTYTVVDFLDPMADGYAVADLVVSRAGMITVAELCAWGLPSILIPLPTAAADHQTHNARVLAEAGAARDASAGRADAGASGDDGRTGCWTTPDRRTQMAEPGPGPRQAAGGAKR